jgi:hypothetical protein
MGRDRDTGGAGLAAVQHRALERALVDEVDARRYFALAGALEAARSPPPSSPDDTPSAWAPPDPDASLAGDVLPAALLSLAAVAVLDDGHGEPVSARTDPWVPGTDRTRSAVRRGARLALRWFDVPAERVAARAGLPEAALTSPDG